MLLLLCLTRLLWCFCASTNPFNCATVDAQFLLLLNMEADLGYGENTELLEHQISIIGIWNPIIKNNLIRNPLQEFRMYGTSLRTLIRAETQLGLYWLWLLKLSVLNEIRDGSKICQMLQFTRCMSIDVEAV